MPKPKIGIGLIGSGFMGRCHANAFRSVGGLFDVPYAPELRLLADATPELAQQGAEALGFEKGAESWQELVADPDIDIVSITSPNAFHEEMALAAIAAGKTVYCEKPLSTTLESAERMMQAAESAGITTMVGFNFLRNPLIYHAKHLIADGAIGEITAFRGRHAENYMADPRTPHSFRTDVDGGGALSDIGSHIISLARFLMGPIAELNAELTTIYPVRPVRAGAPETAPVHVDDMAQMLLHFETGVRGTIEANWAATGRNMDLSFEIIGTKGNISFTQERMNELQLYKLAGANSGFAKIETGPLHPNYGAFCPAAGHHIGFNDLKVIEVKELLEARAENRNGYPDFREAVEVQKVVDTAKRSSKTRQWCDVEGG